MSFYNTVNETGQELKNNWETTNAQEQKIVAVFQGMFFKDYPLSPFEVLQRSGLQAPITSIRRAISDLTKAGILEKTAVRRTGPYGKPSYCWKLKVT